MNQFFRRVLSGLALLVAVVGTTGCQHESQAEQETVRTVSYRAVLESNKPVSEKVDTWIAAMSQEDKVGQLMMISLHGSTIGQSQKDVIRKYRVSGVMLTNENLINKNQVKTFTSDIMQTAITSSMVTPYIAVHRDRILHGNESFLRLPKPNRWGNCLWIVSLIWPRDLPLKCGIWALTWSLGLMLTLAYRICPIHLTPRGQVT